MTVLNLTDHPVATVAEDLLGRARFAELVAEETRSLDASRGVIVGVLGPWGVGKTSLLNMIGEQLAKEPPLPIIRFNPWLFSGTEQLVATFFEELAAELRMQQGRIASLADELEAYGDALSPLRFLPIVGPWLDKIGSGGAAVGRLLRRRTKERRSVGSLRKLLEERLSLLERPIVVVIDDIDRLSSPEIREIFKLVRLTASFPNIVYVLAFDRARVQAALTDDGTDGRAYLEKILQVAYEVPAVPLEVLHRVFLHELDQVLTNLPPARFDEASWPDIYVEIIRPLINNLRDVKRYLASVPLTVRQLGEHVALVDVLAAEALRLFLPETHALLAVTASALTSTSDPGYGSHEIDEDRVRVERFLDSAGSHKEVARDFCKRIFPATLRHFGGSSYGADWLKLWLKDRRLAHPDVLDYYVNRVLGSGLSSAARADEAFAVLGDESALRAFFDRLTPDEIEDTIKALEAFQDDFNAPDVEVAVRVLLEQLPKLRTEHRGMRDFGADLIVIRVVLRLLRRVDNPDELLAITRVAFDNLNTLHGKFVLLTIVGHRENAGHKLISVDDARALDAELREQVAAADPSTLAGEREVLRLLWWTMHPDDESPAPAVDLTSFDLRVAALRDAVTDVRSQVMGTRAVHREHRLAWDILTGVLGGEEPVREVVESITGTDMDRHLAVAVDLARRYLSGWRPRDVGD